MAPIETLPMKHSHSPLSPAHSLVLTNIYKHREDAPEHVKYSLSVIRINSIAYSKPKTAEKLTSQGVPIYMRITPTSISRLSRDKKTGGLTQHPYATTHYANTNRIQVPLPRLLPKEPASSKSFATKMDAMARNPAQTNINPERGNLTKLRDGRRSRKSKERGLGAQHLDYSRMLLVGKLKQRWGKVCEACKEDMRCKCCRDFGARLSVLRKREDDDDDDDGGGEAQGEESEESSESSESSESEEEEESGEDDEEGDGGDARAETNLVSVKRTREVEAGEGREREWQAPKERLRREVAEREKAERERRLGKAEQDAIDIRTRYAQTMIRGTASFHGRVGGVMGPSRW